jgi:hypothetical protein
MSLAGGSVVGLGILRLEDHSFTVHISLNLYHSFCDNFCVVVLYKITMKYFDNCYEFITDANRNLLNSQHGISLCCQYDLD